MKISKIRNDYNIRPLLAAIVLQAVKEAKGGAKDAREWLQNDGLVFMDACGVTLDTHPGQAMDNQRMQDTNTRRFEDRLLT